MTPDKLTSEQRMMLAAVDRFTVERLEPRAADIDESGLFSSELYAEVAELGLLATMIP